MSDASFQKEKFPEKMYFEDTGTSHNTQSVHTHTKSFTGRFISVFLELNVSSYYFQATTCFETGRFGAIEVPENALSAFCSSKIICYFLIIFSLASSQKDNYLVESHAELHASVCPTPQYRGSTASSLRSSQGTS